MELGSPSSQALRSRQDLPWELLTIKCLLKILGTLAGSDTLDQPDLVQVNLTVGAIVLLYGPMRTAIVMLRYLYSCQYKPVLSNAIPVAVFSPMTEGIASASALTSVVGTVTKDRKPFLVGA
jgi:hypothetical protein